MKNKYRYLLLILITFTQLGCEKDFLKQTPDHVISEDLVIHSVDNLKRLLRGSYNEVSNSNYLGRVLYKRSAVKSPDFRFVQTIFNPRNYEQIEYRYQESANNNGSAAVLWLQCFKVIGNLNLILANIDQVSGDDELVRQIKAESFALRGMVYFDLARTFCYPWIMEAGMSQGIPLKLSPTELVIERGTLEQTFKQILLDLHQAEELFAEKAFSAEDSKYMTKLGVQALLARVYLYKQDWENALLYSNKVISVLPQENLMQVDKYVFSDYTSESIFTLAVTNENSTGSNGLGAQFDFRLGGQGDVLASAPLIKLLSAYTDDPRAKFLLMDKEGNQAAFVKYINRGTEAGLSNHNIPVIRLSEIFLIAAEAAFMQGEKTQDKARDYLNILIKRRTTDFEKDKASENDEKLLDRIIQERRKELALEGHEIYDIIRLGKPLERIGQDHINTGLSGGNLSFPSFSPKMVYPIPAEEIVASGMVQTKGY